MKSIWTLALQSLRLLARDKTSVIWMLIVPCLYMVVFGSAFRHQNDNTQAKASLSVLNQDSGMLSERLIRSMESESLDIRFEEQPPEELPLRLLTIPKNFTNRLLKGKKDTLTYQSRTDANIEAGMAAEMGVRKSAYRMLADLAELKVKHRKIDEKGFQMLDDRPPLINLESSYAGVHETIPSGFEGQVPAQIVQFTLLILFIYAGSMLYEEKAKGLLRRTRLAPISFSQIYFGKLLGAIMVGVIQMTILLAVGRLGFGVYLGNSIPALILITLTFATSIGALGLILGFLIRNGEKLLGISIISGLGMAAFSGCWWPIEVTPDWMQKAALFLPSGLALKGFHRLISFGDGFNDVLPYILGQAGFAILFSLLFALIFKRLRKTEQLV
ncbi:ABC transporter permease [candidate division KSB1 bacterium]|nr:ABC transporter permease [candidate division KSB1 bacterium]